MPCAMSHDTEERVLVTGDVAEDYRRLYGDEGTENREVKANNNRLRETVKKLERRIGF